MGSFIVNGENNATQRGTVVTNTTELATEVYWSEEIQVAKCIARKMPDRVAKISSFLLIEASSFRRV
jgi:hypothetical protein